MYAHICHIVLLKSNSQMNFLIHFYFHIHHTAQTMAVIWLLFMHTQAVQIQLHTLPAVCKLGLLETPCFIQPCHLSIEVHGGNIIQFNDFANLELAMWMHCNPELVDPKSTELSPDSECSDTKLQILSQGVEVNWDIGRISLVCTHVNTTLLEKCFCFRNVLLQ